ncbi:FecR domain-containing protein [Carboxylicivirga sediminis]|uniref:FecR domain-containing protein n=1 Tax=Carboxylicivirga sediminis TaxID=2006564 RepID=A0A941IWJ9_9BACT|nr:FecR domain-containing protein [Carboxylicivirga sediminis]MBR8535861.1 FecR domain-containing protein [Carboxylicivirga sediminis]
MDLDRICRYILDVGGEDELLKTALWIKADKKRIREYQRLKRVIALTGESKDISDATIERAYHSFTFTRSRELIKPKRVFTKIIQYAAAVVLVALSWHYFSNEYFKEENQYVVETTFGNSTKNTLPDGTIVWLNGGSKLTYSSQFNDSKSRDVQLEGEAYFTVAKNEDIPFRVKTKSFVIKVLGTSFNVNAYDAASIITTLEEGKVELHNISGDAIGRLNPGQQAVCSAGIDNVSIKQVNTSCFTSWKDGYLVFDDLPLDEVVPKLEQFYNIRIVVDESYSKNCKISGRAHRNVPIEQLLITLETTFGISYELSLTNQEKIQVILK